MRKLGFAAVPMALALAACGESGLVEEDLGQSSSELVALQGETCVPLLAGQSIDAGTVCAAIEGEDLKITYETANGWGLYETHLWAGTSLADMPQTKNGSPKLGNFPYVSEGLGGVTSYSVLVPLAELGLSSQMTVCDPVLALVVSHAVVGQVLPDGTVQTETAYGGVDRLLEKGSWATLFGLTLVCTDEQDPEPPQPVACETAFAFGGPEATCFLDSADIDTSRWGWTNGPLSPGKYLFDIYAAAGKCDLSKGTHVGHLEIAWDGVLASVEYRMFDDYKLEETHLYVGTEPLARDVTGEYTVAPGQYPMQNDLEGAGGDSFVVEGLSGDIYVVAHAVTCSANWP